MPDEPAATATAEPATPQEPQTPEPAKQEPATKDPPLGEAGEKALEAWKQRAKEAEAAAKKAQAKAQEYEDANSSELEKAQKKATKAEQERADTQAELLRFKVAQEKEVPAKLVPLLTASSRDDLEAQADLILENAKPAPPEFDGGAREPASAETPEQAHTDFLRQMFGAPPQT